MAVDVCSGISSPRISFSDDLNGLDFVPVESHAAGSDSHFDLDFDFLVPQTLEISAADELFADGKILPVQIKPILGPRPDPVPEPSNPQPSVHPSAATNKKRLIEFLSAGADEEDDPQRRDSEAKPPPASFWQFRRSISDNSRASGLLRPWQFLTRSNSTGSVPSPKQSVLPKGIQKQHSLKEISINHRLWPNPSASTTAFNPYTNDVGRKNTNCGHKSYGNGGVRINPPSAFHLHHHYRHHHLTIPPSLPYPPPQPLLRNSRCRPLTNPPALPIHLCHPPQHSLIPTGLPYSTSPSPSQYCLPPSFHISVNTATSLFLSPHPHAYNPLSNLHRCTSLTSLLFSNLTYPSSSLSPPPRLPNILGIAERKRSPLQCYGV